MKVKSNAIRVLILLALSLLSCLFLFGCGGETPPVPEVKDVAITAEEGSYGKAGAKHLLTYTAPEGSEVTTSVQLGENAATASDYSYRDGGYYFYTAGEYTVTVYAAKDGMVGSASAMLTVVSGDPYVGDVQIVAAAGETYGRVGALNLLQYSAASGSTVEVTVRKGEETATDVRFDGELNTLVFGSAGQYTVTVTATLGSSSAQGEAQIEIIAVEPPEVGLTLDQNTVAEDGTVTLTRSAVYEGTDRTLTEETSVRYRKGKTGPFRESDEYTLKGDMFIPHLAGQWRIEYTVVSKGGATATASAELTCTPAAITLAAQTQARLRIATNNPTEVGYLVTGAADKYEVTFDTHGNADVTAEAGDGYSVRVTSSKVDYFTVTVVYTHRADSSVKKTVDLGFYSVESLYYAPVWGEDPFDGMPEEVLTNMGHLLYLNATGCGGRKLAASNAVYEVVEKNVTASAGNNEAGVRLASNNEGYPYLFMDNLDDGVAQGNFTLKATLTDPFTGYSAVALKKFIVTPTGNDNGSAASTIENYVRKYPDFYRLNGFTFSSILGHDIRLNMILTKTGTIVDRVDAGMTLNNGNQIAIAKLESGADNCRLEFKFTLVASAQGAAELGIGLRTVTHNGWAGSFDLTLKGGKLGMKNSIGGAKYSHILAGERTLKDGEAVYVRIDRRTSGGVAEYTVYMKAEGGQYQACYCFGFDVSSSTGNAGAPVAEFQFDHHSAGCFAIEDLTVTRLA